MRVKICGITTPSDGRQAALLGADAIGLNFYPGSRRFVTDETAEAILRELPPFVEAAGVFVNVPPAEAARRVERLGCIGMVQWHGDAPEPPPAWPCRFVPAFPIRDRTSLEHITAYLGRCREVGRMPAAVLVDAHVPGAYGGTGRTAPWGLLADFRPGVPLVLGGGLTPENVAEAVRTVRPYAVDVASGVESVPGRKDPDRVRRFIEAAHEAAER
jgi:phosphoribosylanthranilate isomerase